MFFVKNENGVWDNYNCYECCSDCNHPHEHCRCPWILNKLLKTVFLIMAIKNVKNAIPIAEQIMLIT